MYVYVMSHKTSPDTIVSAVNNMQEALKYIDNSDYIFHVFEHGEKVATILNDESKRGFWYSFADTAQEALKQHINIHIKQYLSRKTYQLSDLEPGESFSFRSNSRVFTMLKNTYLNIADSLMEDVNFIYVDDNFEIYGSKDNDTCFKRDNSC